MNIQPFSIMLLHKKNAVFQKLSLSFFFQRALIPNQSHTLHSCKEMQHFRTDVHMLCQTSKTIFLTGFNTFIICSVLVKILHQTRKALHRLNKSQIVQTDIFRKKTGAVPERSKKILLQKIPFCKRKIFQAKAKRMLNRLIRCRIKPVETASRDKVERFFLD